MSGANCLNPCIKAETAQGKVAYYVKQFMTCRFVVELKFQSIQNSAFLYLYAFLSAQCCMYLHAKLKP